MNQVKAVFDAIRVLIEHSEPVLLKLTMYLIFAVELYRILYSVVTGHPSE